MLQPPIPSQSPSSIGDVLSATTVLKGINKSNRESIYFTTSTMIDDTTTSVGSILCQANCSGNGECRDGSCYCMVIILTLSSYDQRKITPLNK